MLSRYTAECEQASDEERSRLESEVSELREEVEGKEQQLAIVHQRYDNLKDELEIVRSTVLVTSQHDNNNSGDVVAEDRTRTSAPVDHEVFSCLIFLITK